MAITIRSDIDEVEADDRDYGSIVGRNRVKAKVNYNKRTQVFDATHDGAGNRLPYMYRSFISFTYGGRYIEDFGLIAITENNSLNRNLSANFEDIVTSPAVSDGQFYWGTHYQNNQLSLTLFTDYISQKNLDDFKSWFRPGVERELILAENPFRGIMARVGTVSTMEMLPDEERVEFKMAGTAYKTSITSYKGSIHLTFTMDDPFWYSLFNVLDYQLTATSDDMNAGVWVGIDGQPQRIADSPDALKIIYEDRIPTLAMFSGDIDTLVARGDGNVRNTTSDIEQYPGSLNIDPLATVSGDDDDISSQRAHTSGYVSGVQYYGYVGLFINTMRDSMFPTFEPGRAERKYLYYAGTAPSYPIISFTISGVNFSDGYINTFGNEYAGTAYSEITIEGIEKHTLQLTTPSLFTAYNQAVYILSHNSGLNNVELDELLRNGIHHKKIRDKVCNSYSTSEAALWLSGLTYTFTIDCKTGAAKVNYGGIEENVGDMIKSNHFKIIERNKIDDNGFINLWENDKEYSQLLYHTVNATLSNFKIDYHYMYL